MHLVCVLIFVCLIFLRIGRKDTKDVIDVEFESPLSTNGLVYVKFNKSRRKRICWNPSWGLQEATVTCRQMGYPKAIASNNVPGTPYNSFSFNEISCRGNEQKLADCNYSYNINHPNCKGIVFVRCKEHPAYIGLFDVRLDGEIPSKGALQVRPRYPKERPWEKQCFGLWSNKNSEVVCRQLGYSGVKNTTSNNIEESHLGEVKYACDGRENSLRECPMVFSTCPKQEATYIECILEGDTQQYLDVRINHSFHDVVKLFMYGRWGFICHDSHWNTGIARIVCQELGYIDVSNGGRGTEMRNGNSSFFITPTCEGKEWSITQCKLEACVPQDNYVAAVRCKPKRFPSYDINAVDVVDATQSFNRLFLTSPGFPDTFSYQPATDVTCNLSTSANIRFKVYIHYKMFQLNHKEALVFSVSADDVQHVQYGDSPQWRKPKLVNTNVLLVNFKSNGVTGAGKFRIEIAVVPKDARISLNCMSNTEPISSASAVTQASAGGCIIVILVIGLIICIALWKLGYIHFGKKRTEPERNLSVDLSYIGDRDNDISCPANKPGEMRGSPPTQQTEPYYDPPASYMTLSSEDNDYGRYDYIINPPPRAVDTEPEQSNSNENQSYGSYEKPINIAKHERRDRPSTRQMMPYDNAPVTYMTDTIFCENNDHGRYDYITDAPPRAVDTGP